MTTSRRISTAQRAALGALSLLVCLAALMAGAHAAGALPINTTATTTTANDGTHIPAPVAAFTISPNPALVNTIPVAQAQAQAQAPTRAFIAGGATVGLFGNGDIVTFDATASHGPSAITAYAWDLDGNGSYETTGPAISVEKRRFYRTGTFTIHLRVTDADGQSSVTSHTLIVHRAPTAHIEAQRTTVAVGQEMKLYAGGSTGDPDIARYEWDTNGDGVTDITVTHDQVIPATFQTPGPHSIILRVVDSYGLTATATLPVTVERRPTAVLTATPNPAIVGSTVHFDASGSTSTDSPIVDYKWDLDGDGNFETDTGSNPTLSRRFTTIQRTDVNVLVVDADGFGAVATTELVVEPITTLPHVAISASQLRADVLALTVTCPRTQRVCRGTVSVAALHVSGAFGLTAGQATTLHLRVAPALRSWWRHHHYVVATARTANASGAAVTLKATVRVAR